MRLNCIHRILTQVHYKKVPREKVQLPKRSMKHAHDDKATLKDRKFVAEKY
jgi:polyphosphate kinase